MPDFVIRNLEAADLEDCAALIRAAFAPVAGKFGLTVDNCPTNGAFTRAEHLHGALAAGDQLFGLFKGGLQLGCAQLSVPRRGNAPPQLGGGLNVSAGNELDSPLTANNDGCEMKKLAVHPSAQGQGFGRALLDHARRLTADRGGGRIGIGIIEANTGLKNWYARYGFVHLGVRSFPHLPFTVGLMELRVPAGEGRR